jgi:hypothetical protein
MIIGYESSVCRLVAPQVGWSLALASRKWLDTNPLPLVARSKSLIRVSGVLRPSKLTSIERRC